VKFCEDNDTFCKEQHGFTRGKSCLTNLLETLENWTRSLDEGYGLDMVYLDYKKAFDSVPHRRLLLLEKLKGLGIKGKLLQWLENFLTLRTMIVGIRGTFSLIQLVLSGVPQGSVLAPLLYLMFVNELPFWIKSEMRMFADDTKVWCRIKEEKELQEDLDKLSSWSGIWQLKFNAEKCQVMHIGHSCSTDYYMTGGLSGKTKLESVQEERELGVLIRSDLKSVSQCNKSAATARVLEW